MPTTGAPATTTRHLSARTTARVAELARATGATPYMVLLAAFGATVFRYTHTGDFLVATPWSTAARAPRTRSATSGNTVAMRMRMRAETTFGELLADTRETALGAFAHQRIDLDRAGPGAQLDRRHGAERMTRISFVPRSRWRGIQPPGVRCGQADLRGHLTQQLPWASWSSSPPTEW